MSPIASKTYQNRNSACCWSTKGHSISLLFVTSEETSNLAPGQSYCISSIMNFFTDEITDRHLDTLVLLADGIVHDVSPNKVRDLVSDEVVNRLDEYVKTVTRPSQLPGFKEAIANSINSNSTTSVRMFCMVMDVLNSRIASPALTGSTKLVSEMSLSEREAMLRSWRDSPFSQKNRLFRLIALLTISTFLRVAPEIQFEAIGYPKRDTRDLLHPDYKPDIFEYKMLEPPASDDVELFLPSIDVVIVGSGSGAGVVAHTLAREGIKCLVLEKGKYYKPDELKFDDLEGYQKMYEGGGVVSTENSQSIILAGSTFGGGSTVNWSACLKTPFKVRKEWLDDFNLDWVASESYDNDMEYVLRQMGALTDNVTHSKSNQSVLSGSEKLGYKHRAIAQNNGGHTNHSCGYCHLGCKWGIKQGSMANWLRDAAEHGTQFMDQVEVQKIIRNKKNIAIGLLCINKRNGNHFVIRGPKKFVLSGGSLNTPVVLQKSGFRNKHIGKNLKLHPISALLAVWEKQKTDPHYNSIMTSLCLEAEDLDGKYHGAKIETLLHTPSLEAAFLPWFSSDQIRQDTLKYQYTSAFILLSRDKLSGLVTFDPKKPSTLMVDYEINDFDRNSIATAILYAMDISYIEGAREIIHPYYIVGTFKSDKPTSERKITDSDYQAYRKKAQKTKLPKFGLCYGSAHQMSTCRMSGNGPKDGACDPSGRLFECDNVYVADASAMPTASGANPMVTTMTIARHVGLELAKLMKPGARL